MDHENSNVSSKDRDQFPKGLRVLVVDDDVTCLHLLEKMLQDCLYRVTKCERGEDALSMIRENKGGFDVVLTDVHMPGMDGLQLLAEIANMGMALPVVLFSSDAAKDTVAKGVNGGACDFLVKPIQINTLRILWQHVIRSNQSSSNDSTKELETPHADNGEENSKSLKRSSGAKTSRVVWTPELNQMFIMAVDSLGIDDAKPTKILQIMRKMKGVPHLTRQNVSSHLQKYRTNSKKTGDASDHPSAHSSLINGAGFANQAQFTPPPSSLSRCSGIQNNAASAQYPSKAMSIAPRPQSTGCRMRMPNLVEYPRNSVLPRYQMGLQSQPLPLLQQPNPPLQNYHRQQQLNESAQCPSYAPAPSVGFTSPTNNTHPVLSKQSHNSLIMQTPQTHSSVQILDDTAAARHYLSSTTHPYPLHSQISTHDIQSLSSSTPHPASEQGLPVALGAIGARASKSCGSNIIGVDGELCYRNNHNPVDEEHQVYGNEAMFADMLDTNFFEDLGFGEDIPYLNRYIQDNGVM